MTGFQILAAPAGTEARTHPRKGNDMSSMIDLSTVTRELRAQIMREERDALILAWQNGVIVDLLGAERFMNARIEGLGVESVTGDTTEN